MAKAHPQSILKPLGLCSISKVKTVLGQDVAAISGGELPEENTMSTVDRKIVKLLTMTGSEHALSVLRDAGLKRNYTVEDIERVCYLGIQQLPEYRRTEAAGIASARLEGLQRAYVLNELGNNGMLPKEALQSRLDQMPGPSDMALCDMQIAGLIGFFNETDEQGRETAMVFLTTEGRAKFEERNARLDGQSEELLSPLTSDEKLTLLELLTKIADNAQAKAE